MKYNLKKLHEFHNFIDFFEYADKYMKNIRTDVVDTSVGNIEVRLICKDATIGIWKDYQKYGFIEEYRDSNKERMFTTKLEN